MNLRNATAVGTAKGGTACLVSPSSNALVLDPEPAPQHVHRIRTAESKLGIHASTTMHSQTLAHVHEVPVHTPEAVPHTDSNRSASKRSFMPAEQNSSVRAAPDKAAPAKQHSCDIRMATCTSRRLTSRAACSTKCQKLEPHSLGAGGPS